MKTKIFIVAMLLINTIILKAQITLEHSYNYAVSVVNLSVSGYKYSALDATTQEVKLFNLTNVSDFITC